MRDTYTPLAALMWTTRDHSFLSYCTRWVRGWSYSTPTPLSTGDRMANINLKWFKGLKTVKIVYVVQRTSLTPRPRSTHDTHTFIQSWAQLYAFTHHMTITRTKFRLCTSMCGCTSAEHRFHRHALFHWKSVVTIKGLDVKQQIFDVVTPI